MMVSNAVLGGIADTVAQTITAVRQRSLRKNPGTPNGRDETLAYELDRKDPFTERELIPESKVLPPPFDFERLTRFMAYGFGMAPLQFKWLLFLQKIFPITKTAAFVPAMKRVAFDQLIFAPFGMSPDVEKKKKKGGHAAIVVEIGSANKAIGVACFFTVMTVAEGGGRRAVAHKLRDMYVPTLKANYAVWPAVQVINFRLMPVQFQLVSFCPIDDHLRKKYVLTNELNQPFVSTVGIAWTAYLSLTNASEEAATPSAALDSPNIRLE